MKSRGSLSVELSRIRGERLSREIALDKQIFDEVGFVDDDNYFRKIIKDNWETDNETQAIFYE